MNEPTEIKYPLDENGEPYYAATHISGVQGIDKDSIDTDLTELDHKIAELKNLIQEQDKALKLLNKRLSDVIGDTGWIEYQVPPDMKNKAVSSGFKCAIREVRAGNDLIGKHFVVRSIRLNVSEITGDLCRLHNYLQALSRIINPLSQDKMAIVTQLQLNA